MKCKGEELAAPCGLYCGACRLYVARKRGDEAALAKLMEEASKRLGRPVVPEEDAACDGCLSSTVAIVCRHCQIRSCALEKGISRCSACLDFPCRTIVDFNSDGHPHHNAVLKNLGRQREVSLSDWLKEQEKEWQCAGCGANLHWYEDTCPECNSKVSPA